jgi:hypothetical protein
VVPVTGPAKTALGPPLLIERVDIGFTVKKEKQLDAYSVSGHGFPKTRFGLCIDALEKDPTLHPLTPYDAKLRDLLKALARPGERLPLVIGSHRQAAFRASVAYWIGGEAPKRVESLANLEKLVQTWDGRLPDPAAWHNCTLKAEEEANSEVARMTREASEQEQFAAHEQVEAARIRLSRELGRYLVCGGADPHSLKHAFYQQMKQSAAIAGARLKQCFDRLGGYPDLASGLLSGARTMGRFASGIPPDQSPGWNGAGCCPPRPAMGSGFMRRRYGRFANRGSAAVSTR